MEFTRSAYQALAERLDAELGGSQEWEVMP